MLLVDKSSSNLVLSLLIKNKPITSILKNIVNILEKYKKLNKIWNNWKREVVYLEGKEEYMINLNIKLIWRIMRLGEFMMRGRCCINFGLMVHQLLLSCIFNRNGLFMLLVLVYILEIMRNRLVYNFHLKITTFPNFYFMNIVTQLYLSLTSKVMIMMIKNIYIQEEDWLKDYLLMNFGQVNKNSNLDLIVQHMLRNSSLRDGLRRL